MLIGAYALGMFPTAILIGRTTGHDPTREGSRNPGASNVYRTSGRRAGALVAIGDVLKGAIPAGAGLLVGGRPLGVACWAAAVAGHVFPATRRFRGGKGVATAGGGTLVLFPLVAACCAVVFVVLVATVRKASVGSIAMAVLMPVLVAMFGHPRGEVAVAVGVTLLVLSRHRTNLRRLVRHQELPLSSPGSP
jgi:acyl phosphate:glycerol-3-phosphate acyltransferase